MSELWKRRSKRRSSLSSLRSGFALVKFPLTIESMLSSAHLGVVTIILLLNAIDVIELPNIINQAFMAWVALNVLVLPVASKRFVTPKVVNPKCPMCGGYLMSTELYCESCKSVVKSGIKTKDKE